MRKTPLIAALAAFLALPVLAHGRGLGAVTHPGGGRLRAEVAVPALMPLHRATGSDRPRAKA
mgnify:CR=1 FL=1